MMENNLDRDIREKLQGREIQPSASAWERLSSQLDDAQRKRKKGWFLFMGYAASILLIVSLFLFLNKGEDKTEVQDQNRPSARRSHRSKLVLRLGGESPLTVGCESKKVTGNHES